MSLLKLDLKFMAFYTSSNFCTGDIGYSGRSDSFFYIEKTQTKPVSVQFAARKALERASTEYLESLRISFRNKRKIGVKIDISPLKCDLSLYRSDRIAQKILYGQFKNNPSFYKSYIRSTAEVNALNLVKIVIRRDPRLKIKDDYIRVKSLKGKFLVSLKSGAVTMNGKSVCVVISRSCYGLPMADRALAKALTILYQPELIYTI